MYNKFRLEILTPEREFYLGEAEEVIINSADGEMGILKGHHPMVAGLIPGALKILIDGKWHEAAGSEGFVEVKPDRVIIMVQTVEWPEEIEEARVLQNIKKAEERIRQKKSMLEYKLGKASLARAFARLKVKNRNRGV